MKLLIVDDEARIRALIAKYAAFEGYETEEAENGMQAIEKCREKHYDLIIMDVMMPELDGFSAVREIRKHDSVPVIMLSARGEEYDRIHGFELGMSARCSSAAVKRRKRKTRRLPSAVLRLTLRPAACWSTGKRST